MSLYAAIDGGGTKTDFVLFNETGAVLKKVKTKGCNPNDFGHQRTHNILQLGLSHLLSDYSGCNTPLKAVFAGVAGGTAGNNKVMLNSLLSQLLPFAENTAADSDAVCALSSGIAKEDGCVIICGTGSTGYVRANGIVKRVGGWGYLFDKGGSGYDIGRDAVYHALCSYDMRGDKTLLTSLLQEALGMPVNEAIPLLYDKGKPEIAALAPLVFKAEKLKDSAAIEILRDNSKAIALLINTLCNQIDTPVCKIVLVGSVFKDWAQLKQYIIPFLINTHTFILPEQPPIYGSAIEALALSELSADNSFKNSFSTTLKTVACLDLSIT